MECIQTIFRATVIAKLTYASPAWWGFANAEANCNATRILPEEEYKSWLYYYADQPSVSSVGELCDSADDSLFRAISENPNHPLHNLLPPKIVRKYDLRKRTYQFQLPTKVEISIRHELSAKINSFLKTRIDHLMAFL